MCNGVGRGAGNSNKWWSLALIASVLSAVGYTVKLGSLLSLAFCVGLSKSLVMKFNNRKESIECIIPYGQVLNVPLWSPPHFLRPLTHLAVDGARRLALASYHNDYDMWGGGVAKLHVYALQLWRKSDLCCWKELATLLPFGFINSFFTSEKAWSDVWEAGTELLSLRFGVMTPGQVPCLWGMEKIPSHVLMLCEYSLKDSKSLWVLAQSFGIVVSQIFIFRDVCKF